MTRKDSGTAIDSAFNWTGLIAESRQSSARQLRDFAGEDAADMTALGPSRLLASYFAGIGIGLSRAAVVHGSAKCTSAIAALAKHLPRTINELEPPWNTRRSRLVLDVLSFINGGKCCGARLPAEADHAEERWLPRLLEHRSDLNEFQRESAAFASLAVGLPELISPFLGSTPLPKKVKPGKVFDFDTTGLLRYLGAAVKAGAPPEVVRDAWYDFIADFPTKLASDTITWADLLWCARAVMVHIEHRPVETVADALHELVTTKFT
jgi:hypothetical protein